MADTTTAAGIPVGTVAVIPVNKIRENQVALRAVDRESEEYLDLVKSVKQNGILNPILVRELKGEAGAEQTYGLIDGLHRWNAAMDAGLEVIPVQIRDMEQAEIEEAQIVANVQKIETKPIQYTKQLERLMARNPVMTTAELAGRLSKSTEWLNQRFGLLKLEDGIATLVDDGKIKLSNGYQLAKLPKEDQANYVDKAMTMDPGEFTPTIAARLKQIREARAQGRAANPPVFEPVAHQRKWTEVKQEFEQKSIGKALIAESKATTAQEGFDLAIAWASNMDPRSRQQQIDKNNADKVAREEAKKRKELERAEQRQKEAAERAEELKKEGVTLPEPAAV